MYTVHARSKICPCVPPCTLWTFNQLATTNGRQCINSAIYYVLNVTTLPSTNFLFFIPKCISDIYSLLIFNDHKSLFNIYYYYRLLCQVRQVQPFILKRRLLIGQKRNTSIFLPFSFHYPYYYSSRCFPWMLIMYTAQRDDRSLYFLRDTPFGGYTHISSFYSTKMVKSLYNS